MGGKHENSRDKDEYDLSAIKNDSKAYGAVKISGKINKIIEEDGIWLMTRVKE